MIVPLNQKHICPYCDKSIPPLKWHICGVTITGKWVSFNVREHEELPKLWINCMYWAMKNDFKFVRK